MSRNIYFFIVIFCSVLLEFSSSKVVQREGRIVGGQNAEPNQFPYMASLKRRNTNNHFCAGSIVAESWVLTAAHCTIDETILTLEVSVGSHLINSGKIHRIQSIRNHPQFSRSSLANDVALLKVLEKFQWSPSIQPVELINRQVSTGTLIVSGWGRTSTNGQVPTNLQFINTNAIARKICEEFINLNQDTFCTMNVSHKGICFGDSGGPLVHPGEGQVGITSFVINTCAGTYPDGFSSVYFHRNWILENIRS